MTLQSNMADDVRNEGVKTGTPNHIGWRRGCSLFYFYAKKSEGISTHALLIQPNHFGLT